MGLATWLASLTTVAADIPWPRSQDCSHSRSQERRHDISYVYDEVERDATWCAWQGAAQPGAFRGTEGDGKSAAAGFRRNGGLERAAHRRKLLQPKLKVRS